jgi:hypothetical protein
MLALRVLFLIAARCSCDGIGRTDAIILGLARPGLISSWVRRGAG